MIGLHISLSNLSSLVVSVLPGSMFSCFSLIFYITIIASETSSESFFFSFKYSNEGHAALSETVLQFLDAPFSSLYFEFQFGRAY